MQRKIQEQQDKYDTFGLARQILQSVQMIVAGQKHLQTLNHI